MQRAKSQRIKFAPWFFIAGLGPAYTQPIVFAMPIYQSAPMVFMGPNGEVRGILRDLGQEVAHELKMEVEFVALPGRRLHIALGDGAVDAICGTAPAWVDVPLNWSKPVFSTRYFIMSARSDKPITAVSELRSQVVGAVTGDHYPELDSELGAEFLRDNSPSIDAAIRKLLAKRYRFMVIDQLTLDYQVKFFPGLRRLPLLKIADTVSMCGFSKASAVPLERINRAIHHIVVDGRLQKIINNYVARRAD